MTDHLPLKTLERLLLYQHLLQRQARMGRHAVYSHELAAWVNGTPAQIRRDLMYLGAKGNSARGYDLPELLRQLDHLVEGPGRQQMVLVGVGNIGRALLSHFSTKDSSFDIVAAFDTDPSVVHRVICGVHCYPMSEFEERVFPHPVRVGVICTPEEHAQGVADQMVRLGIRGILNFATVALRLPEHVTVEDMPISLLLKKLTILSQ